MNKKNSAWLTWGLVGALVLIAAGFGAWRYTHSASPETRFLTEQVERGDIIQAVSANGTVNPVVVVNVGTQVSGTVRKLYVDFNSPVQKGQVLAELDPSLLQAQANQSAASLASAQASLHLAQANETRSRALYAKEYVSRMELDQAVQARDAARAQVNLALAQVSRDRTNLGYTQIRSPVSGVVVDRQVDVGQTVAASFQTPTLFKIAQDLRRMQIHSSVAEADIGQIRVGQPVRFTVDAFPDRTFRGVVNQVRLNPTTAQNVVTYDVVVDVDNADERLIPGMTAYINVVTDKRENVLRISNAALRFRPQTADKDKSQAAGRRGGPGGRGAGKRDRSRGEAHRAIVYVLRGESLTPVPIQTGISDGKFTEVADGDLKAGDKVVMQDTQAKPGGDKQPVRGPHVRMF